MRQDQKGYISLEIQHLLRWQLLPRWRQERVRVRVMIGFLVRGRARINITIRIRVRVRVGVTFNVSDYYWSNCRRNKCCTFVSLEPDGRDTSGRRGIVLQIHSWDSWTTGLFFPYWCCLSQVEQSWALNHLVHVEREDEVAHSLVFSCSSWDRTSPLICGGAIDQYQAAGRDHLLLLVFGIW